MIDMPMPEKCKDCIFRDENCSCIASDYNGAGINVGCALRTGGRDDRCPLKHIGNYYSEVFNGGYKAGKESIIRCKDCKYWSAERINDFNKCRRWINVGVKNFATMGNWFCADGERRTDDA
jgi:hypothetical protein